MKDERSEEAVAAILNSLSEAPSKDARAALEDVVRDSEYRTANRLRALAIYAAGLEADSGEVLALLCSELKDGPVLAEALRLLTRFPKLQPGRFLVSYTASKVPDVRAAAAVGARLAGRAPPGCSAGDVG